MADEEDKPKPSKFWVGIKYVLSSGAVLSFIVYGYKLFSKVEEFSRIKEQNESLEQKMDSQAEAMAKQAASMEVIIQQNKTLFKEIRSLEIRAQRSEIESKVSSYMLQNLVIPLMRDGHRVSEISYETNNDDNQEENWIMGKLRDAAKDLAVPEDHVVRPRNEIDDMADRLKEFNEEYEQQDIVDNKREQAQLFNDDTIQAHLKSVQEVQTQFKK